MILDQFETNFENTYYSNMRQPRHIGYSVACYRDEAVFFHSNNDLSVG